MKEIPLTQGKVALVDDEDYDYAKRFKWHAEKRANTWYARRCDGKKHRRMHRELLSVSPELQVDHINHDGLDNRRCNIRVCSNAENLRNRRGAQSNSKTGILGVSEDRRLKKPFSARIKIMGKRHYLGCFSTAREAFESYNAKARELFGEFFQPSSAPEANDKARAR